KMTFNFRNMTEQHQTVMHFANFGEPVTVYSSAGVAIQTTAIIQVTEEAEATEDGTGIIVRAKLAIRDTAERFPGSVVRDPMVIRSTWQLEFRGQRFGIEALSPPVAGIIKLNAIAL